jgi:RNA polymerase sigma-70 factor (ECF subfamily)
MPQFPETNPSLIARVKDLGDGVSWAEFLGIYQPVVFRMARRRGLQDADAHDVMQQVFLSISRSIEGWMAGEDQPPFRAWLATIVRNAITKSLTRKPPDVAAGSTSMLNRLGQLPQAAPTADEIQTEAKREIVRWAAAQIRSEFSEGTWDSFWQTAIEGISVPDVAAVTGRSPGSIYVARFRVTARLKEKILELSQHWEFRELPE